MATLSLAFLAGCADSLVVLHKEEKITDPKVIAMSAPDAPWVDSIEQAFQRYGFKVIRVDDKLPYQGNPDVQYLMSIHGRVLKDKSCAEGSYYLRDLEVFVTDRRTGHSVMEYDGVGCSGDSSALPGTVIGSFVHAIMDLWKW